MIKLLAIISSIFAVVSLAITAIRILYTALTSRIDLVIYAFLISAWGPTALLTIIVILGLKKDMSKVWLAILSIALILLTIFLIAGFFQSINEHLS